jgi:nucleoside phosphorylase
MPPAIPARLAASPVQPAVTPQLAGLPALAPVDWTAAGLAAPAPVDTPTALPQADVVLISWATSEWAATHHVFCASSESMSHGQAGAAHFSGWEKDAADLIAGPPDWTFWGEFQLVDVNGTRVLLYKSNTHLDWPGADALTTLIQRLAAAVRPKLIVSTGTAGGATSTDHVGTVVIVRAAALYDAGRPASEWTIYTSAWQPATTALDRSSFRDLLMPIPITSAALNTLVGQFDQQEHAGLTLEQLDPLSLNRPDPVPAIRNHTGDGTPLLTASTFLVGLTDNTYAAYGCIEMDDAIIAAECQKADVQYGSVRNLSDPAQPAELSAGQAGAWGSAIYRGYGLYTSFNGALAAAAVLA